MTKKLKQKLKGQDMVLEEKNKISDVSKLSILSFTQNKKTLEILESVLLLQILTVVVTQDSERTKIIWGKTLKVKIRF